MSRTFCAALWRGPKRGTWIGIVSGLLAMLALPGASSAVCHCWCAVSTVEDFTGKGTLPGEVIDYGQLKQWGNCTVQAKKKEEECNHLCSVKAASDGERYLNDAWWCSTLNRPFDGWVTAYSHIGTRRWNAVHKRQVKCVKSCKCPQGWYDPNRDSCVTGTDCDVPGMPDGDKGGGYFAWHEDLFLNIPGASDCVIEPPKKECKWTGWLNRDAPGGAGDYETLKDFIQAGQACSQPESVECRTRPGHQDWSQTGQTYHCTANQGGVCVNKEQPTGQSCLNYEVRFCCP